MGMWATGCATGDRSPRRRASTAEEPPSSSGRFPSSRNEAASWRIVGGGGRRPAPLPGVHPRQSSNGWSTPDGGTGEGARAASVLGVAAVGAAPERGHAAAAHARRGVRGAEGGAQAAGARGGRAPGGGGGEAGGVLRLGGAALGRRRRRSGCGWLAPRHLLTEHPLRTQSLDALTGAVLDWAYTHTEDADFLRKSPSEVALYLLARRSALATAWSWAGWPRRTWTTRRRRTRALRPRSWCWSCWWAWCRWWAR